jgi:hypothetical protein
MKARLTTRHTVTPELVVFLMANTDTEDAQNTAAMLLVKANKKYAQVAATRGIIIKRNSKSAYTRFITADRYLDFITS